MPEIRRIGLRIELAWRQHAAQAAERRAHFGPQRFGSGRRDDAVSGPCEQVLTYGFAQSFQRIADGRLRQRQPFSGSREVSLGHHDVEDAQEVEVERAEIEWR